MSAGTFGEGADKIGGSKPGLNLPDITPYSVYHQQI